MKTAFLVDASRLAMVCLLIFSCVQPAHSFQTNKSKANKAAHAQHHVISAVAGVHGIISPQGNSTVIRSGELRLTITPDKGWQAESVIVDGVNQGSLSMYMFTNISEDHTIRVSFTKAEKAVTVGVISPEASNDKKRLLISVFAGPHGSISSNGDLFVSPHGSVDLTIAGDSGYAVDSVVVDGGYVGSLTKYSFTNVMYDHVLLATFTKKRE